MNISMKSRYAVRALTELARVRADAARQAGAAGRHRRAPRHAAPVPGAGVRGAAPRRASCAAGAAPSGGYSLARPADEITVLDVVAALDGVPSPAECTQGLCDEVDGCGASSVWIEAQQALEDVLTATTIGDLLRREDALRAAAPMYHI